MNEEKLVVSWGFIVTAKDYDDAEKKAKAKLLKLLGEDAFKKLEEATDELCVSDFVEPDEEEEEFASRSGKLTEKTPEHQDWFMQDLPTSCENTTKQEKP